MEMPFGKHRGEEVEDIPLDYLRWVIENVDIYSEELKAEIRERIRSEGKNTTTVEDDEEEEEQSTGMSDEMREAIEQTIRQWYRAMVKKIRPELPGNEKEANVLNDGYKLLKELFDIG